MFGQVSTQLSGPGGASLWPRFLEKWDWDCPPLCKHFLWHRLPEGLMFQLEADSSFSNLLLSNTTSMHSAQNLSICLNSSVPLTPHPVSHQVLRPNIPQCFPITSQPYAGVIVAHLNYAAGPSLLSLLPSPKSSCTLYPKEKF